MKTLQDWQNEIKQRLTNLQVHFLEVGETLYNAHYNLMADDYQQLVEYAEQFGYTASDLLVAIAAYRSTLTGLDDKQIKKENKRFKCRPIDPRLVFAGAKNSKILSMPADQQQRLLSNERFVVRMTNGELDEPKTWSELSDDARNTLLGKGGKILHPDEQRSQRRHKDKVATHLLGSVEGLVEGHKKGLLVETRDGTARIRVFHVEFLRKILNAGSWDGFTEAVAQMQREVDEQESIEQESAELVGVS